MTRSFKALCGAVFAAMALVALALFPREEQSPAAGYPEFPAGSDAAETNCPSSGGFEEGPPILGSTCYVGSRSRFSLQTRELGRTNPNHNQTESTDDRNHLKERLA